MPANWSAVTSWGEVAARANGRSRHHSVKRLQAELRRAKVAIRLTELQREAMDRDPGLVAWHHYGLKAQLAREFGVSYSTMIDDVKSIEQRSLAADHLRENPSQTRAPKEPPQPDPRFRWAYEEPTTVGGHVTERRRARTRMDQRITLRVPDELYQRLTAAMKAQETDITGIMRQVLLAHLNRAQPETKDQSQGHALEDCAREILRECEPGTRQRITAAADRLELPLSDVVTSLLLRLSKDL
jgi:predicted DNA-binding protein